MISSYSAYILFPSFSLLLAYLYEKFDKKIYFYSSAIILIAILGLRFEVGVDYASYKDMFKIVSELGILGYYKTGGTVEPGYIILNYIISHLGFNFEILVLVVSTLTILMFYTSIRKEKRYISFTLSILIFITTQYFYYFGIMRMGLAVAIASCSYRDFIDGKKLAFFLKVFLAFTMHYSAIFLGLIFFIKFDKKRKIKKRSRIFIVIVFIILLLLIKTLGPHLSRYKHYFMISNEIFNIKKILNWLFFYILIFIYSIKIKNNEYKFYFYLFLIKFCIDLLGQNIGISRMVWYFVFSLCFLLPYVIRKTKNIVIKMLLLISVLIFCFYYSYISYFGNSPRGKTMIPYKTIFSKEVN